MRTCSLIGFVILAGLACSTAWISLSGIVSFLLALAAGGCLILALWPRKLPKGVVLELAGIQWTEEDFCRGWEIDGRTGSGKTASGVVPIIYQLKNNRPDVGILALDTKGDLSEPLSSHPLLRYLCSFPLINIPSTSLPGPTYTYAPRGILLRGPFNPSAEFAKRRSWNWIVCHPGCGVGAVS